MGRPCNEEPKLSTKNCTKTKSGRQKTLGNTKTEVGRYSQKGFRRIGKLVIQEGFGNE